MGRLRCGLAFLALATSCSDAEQAGVSTDGPVAAACAESSSSASLVRVSADVSGLISQYAFGAIEPSLAPSEHGGWHVVFRDDLPSGAGDIVFRTIEAELDERWLNLSETSGESAAPALTAAGQRVAVSWAERTGEAKGVFLRVSNDAGASFEPPIRLSDDVGDWTRPNVTLSAEGDVLVVWDGAARDADDLRAERAVRFARVAGGATPLAPVLIAQTSGLAMPVLASTGGDGVVAAFIGILTPEGGHVVYVSRSDDGGSAFSPPTAVAGETYEGAKLAADAAGSLYLYWQAGTTARGAWEGRGMVLSRSDDQGASFEEIAVLGDGASGQPWLASDPSGALALGWTSCAPADPADCSHFLARSLDAELGLSEPVELASPVAARGVLSPGPFGLDSDGHVAALWSGTVGIMSDVVMERRAAFDEAGEAVSLSAHEDVTADDVAAEAMAPTIAMDPNGGLVVAWAQTADFLPSSRAGVFVSRSEDGGGTFSEPLRVASVESTYAFDCGNVDPRNTSRSWRDVALAVGERELALLWSAPVVSADPETRCLRRPRQIFLGRSSDGGRTFSDPINLSAGDLEAGEPSAVYDADDRLTATWLEMVDEGFSRYRRVFVMGVPAGEEPPVPVSADAGQSASASAGPVVAGVSGALSVAWPYWDPSGSGIAGILWSRIESDGVVSPTREAYRNDVLLNTVEFAATARSNREIALLWVAEDGVRLLRSSDGVTFGEPALLAGAGNTGVLGGGGLALSPSGHLFALFAERVGGAPGEIQLVEGAEFGAELAPARALFATPGDSHSPAGSTDAAGNLFVAFRDDGDAPGRMQIVHGCRAAKP